MSGKTIPGHAAGLDGEGVLAQKIRAAFDQPIPRARLSIFYQLALLITTLVVVTLPLIYVAFIAALGYGLYQYAIHGLEWVGLTDSTGGRAVQFKLFAYVAPLGVGAILIGFMLKPFLAPRVDRVVGPTLLREDQPLLFGFVERLCEKLGAPVPRRIEVIADVNASAGFRRGWLSFFGNDLVLAIGMPLAAGLSVRQLGGIIAHEFGHFRQGTAMRMDYLTRSVNNWFARVVYTRDGWDQALINGVNSEIGYIALFCLLMQLAVWLTRRVLWVLMLVAHGVSCFMSRQMEYDADKAFAIIAGGDAVGTTLTRLNLLGVVMQQSLQTRGEGMSSQELYDNLPEYVVKGARLVGRDKMQQFSDQLMKEKTKIFDTHPTLRQRVEHAAALDTPGILSIDTDASLLFRDFTKLSKAVTYAFYRHHLGDRLDRMRLVETEQAIGELNERGERVSRLERYLGVYDTGRPPRIALDAPAVPASAKQALADLKAAREKMTQQREARAEAHASAAQAEHDFVRAAVFHAWLGFAPDPMRAKAPDGLKTPQDAKTKLQQAEAELKTQRAALAELEKPLNQRLSLALQLLMVPELDRIAPNLSQCRARAADLVTTLQGLTQRHAHMTRLDIQRGVLTGWSQMQVTLRGNQHALQYGQKLLRQARESLDQFVQSTHTLHARPDNLPTEPDDADTYALDTQQLASARGSANLNAIDFAPLEKFYKLYDETLGELIGIAEAVETQLRLAPIFTDDGTQAS